MITIIGIVLVAMAYSMYLVCMAIEIINGNDYDYFCRLVEIGIIIEA